MKQQQIRNFCIIAHVDHGKSTLSDRLIEYTHSVPQRQMHDQLLDDMDLERERGITIKLNSVQLVYHDQHNQQYYFNLIDTPGHVDFTYEVSRSLAACEGAILVVDATQGIQAQTVANTYLAIDANLTIIPVINKIDLPSADVDWVIDQLKKQLGIYDENIPLISARNGTNIDQVITALIKNVPPPKGEINGKLRALIFDAYSDPYKGIVCYVRIVDGIMQQNTRLLLLSNNKPQQIMELGVKTPLAHTQKEQLIAGEVGYVILNTHDIRDVRVGDTMVDFDDPSNQALPGYKKINPMVYAGLFPIDSSQFEILKDAMEKMVLCDASLIYEVENSQAFGFGVRCGFLGLLHLDIVCERLKREHKLDLIVTAPSVAYEITLTNGTTILVDNLAKFPERSKIRTIAEPFVKTTIFCNDESLGNVMKTCEDFRGSFVSMSVEHEKTKKLIYKMPLAEVISHFFDRLKSVSKGYVTFDYDYIGMSVNDLVKVDILLNKEKINAFSFIAHQTRAYYRARKICDTLKEIIPQHLFEITIQASIGQKVIARADIRALRKNVTAKCYGGDVSRKKKLLERQKEGKKRMKQFNKISLPQDVFIEIFKEN